MSLKTKIIVICCLSILISSAVCNVAVYHLVKSSALDAAEGQSLKNALAAQTDINNKVDFLGDGSVNGELIQYIIKEEKDDLIVCFYYDRDKNEEIFNSTIFEYKDFERLKFEKVFEEGDLSVAELKWEGMHYLAYILLQENGYSIYKLEDITYVWERMRLLKLGLLSLSVIVILIATSVIFAVLSKVLKPLQMLNKGAKQIARGNYDDRIQVVRNDEIGELSINFNKMADAVEEQIIKLRDARERRTLFMGNLTHELKTPMTAISGYAKTLLTAKLSDDEKEEALTYIYEESCRLERLSKKMMNLLMLEEDDKIKFDMVSADILFQNAREACQISLEEDGIILESNGNGHCFSVDSDLFTEVLINLTDNARKASKKGDKIILAAHENTIEVIDFGKGIPDEEKEKIIEPFYMIDKSRSRKSGGAGLGLAITVLILKRHNCVMNIESELGKGTRIILQFV